MLAADTLMKAEVVHKALLLSSEVRTWLDEPIYCLNFRTKALAQQPCHCS